MRETALVGDDTDLLVLLFFHADANGHGLYFRPEQKSNAKTIHVWDIRQAKEQLGPAICTNILFLHAFMGCDMTLRLHGLGKAMALKKFETSEYFRTQANMFESRTSTTDKICEVGENAFVSLYGGRSGIKLDKLRYEKYCQKVATRSTKIQPQALPQTSTAARFHSLRVRVQVEQWGQDNFDTLIEDFGWSVQQSQMLPVMTDRPPALCSKSSAVIALLTEVLSIARVASMASNVQQPVGRVEAQDVPIRYQNLTTTMKIKTIG